MDDRFLLVFSLAFSLWAVAAIVVPYIQRKTDLLTARNFFLLGALLYVGFSGIKAAREGHYFQYSHSVYLVYYTYIVVFFAVFSLAYKKLRWPARAADRRFLRWPITHGIGLWFPLLLCLATVGAQIAVSQVPGLRIVASRAGSIAPVFALAFGLAIWRTNKMNPGAIAVVLVALLAGAYLSFSIGGGRRLLYAFAVTIPFCFYC
ncbi:MAG TPA: hypothetical protein PJ982_08150 [Lacipirellulaceae bacterium]|nr:hypothetical protein [Lacipirellulaceae bacterium]